MSRRRRGKGPRKPGDPFEPDLRSVIRVSPGPGPDVQGVALFGLALREAAKVVRPQDLAVLQAVHDLGSIRAAARHLKPDGGDERRRIQRRLEKIRLIRKDFLKKIGFQAATSRPSSTGPQ